ncbi:MAG: CPBP family intramembrane metalloprotease [Desulfobacterales bacterium]|jgi:membrane protease YdiL (CAAX protease family)
MDKSNYRNRGVALYFFLAYLFTWTFHIAIPVQGLAFSFDITSPAMLLYLMGLLGPLASALFLTGRFEGWTGVKRLLRGVLRWRFNPIWYLFAIFIVALLRFTNIGLHIRAVPNPWQWMNFGLFFIIGQLWVVVGEEYGWRGFALPRLQSSIGSLGASLIIGLLWASWHLPMFFIPGSPQYTQSFFYSFSRYVCLVTFWSIIMTMLYNRTSGSVLVCMIFHAFLNIAAFTIRMPREANMMLYLYTPIIILAIALLPRPLFVLNFSKRCNDSGR